MRLALTLHRKDFTLFRCASSAGPQLRSTPNGEDFAPVCRRPTTKIESLREAPTIQTSHNPTSPPCTNPARRSAGHALRGTPPAGFVFRCSAASETRRGHLSAQGAFSKRSLPRWLEGVRALERSAFERHAEQARHDIQTASPIQRTAPIKHLLREQGDAPKVFAVGEPSANAT